MTMEWNNRDYRFDSSGVSSSSSFQEHNESMARFRKSHADVAMVNGSRLDEFALLEKMRPLQIRHMIMETGGSRSPEDITGWSTLVPLWKTSRYKPSRN
jgi:hypothetical protein